MIASRYAASALLSLLALGPSVVRGHGYLKSPRSRNFVAHEDGVWWPLTDTKPLPEPEPQSANIGGTDARCGVIAERNYDEPENGVGGQLEFNPQECWQPGAVVDLSVVLTAHHKGHFEFKASPIQPFGIASQSDFDKYPLEFVSEELSPGESRDTAPKDEEYPVRAYIPPEDWTLQYKYQLPANLEGDHVLLQWYYVTANSCKVEGYDQYPFPAGWDPNIHDCPGPVPPDGRGLPEQFWNCAEVKISTNCPPSPNGPPPPSPPTPETTAPTTTSTTSVAPTPSGVATTTSATATTTVTTDATTSATATTATTTTAATTTTVTTNPQTNPPNPNCANNSGQCSATTTCADVGHSELCCSQWGWCGSSAEHCGECCQNGPCINGPTPPPPTPSNPPPSPTPPTPTPPTPDNYTADHGEDSRVIAYVGNWQACPTAEQIDAYSHVVVAFAVSYTWSPSKNICKEQCDVGTSVPICVGQSANQVAEWQALGKKVILSFGGAGMGGSWSGDQNNCWDYCFGKEDALSSQLVAMIGSQGFDGVDIDYEYCYDVEGTQSGRCDQRTSLYSDLKAQTFLNDLTHLMRQKLDDLQTSNGYSRGRYEVTHAPMDTDLTPSTRPYFQILHERRADLDFLMPQFYNGVTRPALGVDGSGGGQMAASALFGSLSNELFDSEPHKVVFGHCISDCSGTGSNINSAQAVQVMSDLKEVNSGEFACNGGAFFWVALHDNGGAWSDAVMAEVSETAGCSNSNEPPPTTTTIATTTSATAATTTSTTTVTTTTEPNNTTTTDVPETTTATEPDTTTTTTTTTTTEQPETTTTPTTTNSGLVVSNNPRCGTSEVDAREHCKNTCVSNADCVAGELCWGVHPNYCGSIPKRTYTDPALSIVNHRCGLKELAGAEVEIHARTFCGEPCLFGTCDDPDYECKAVHQNYCGSEYTTDDGPTTEATTTTTTQPDTTTTTTTTTTEPDTTTVATTTTATTGSTTTTSTTTDEPTTTTTTTEGPIQLVINQQNRCGTSEVDAREHCKNVCESNLDCAASEYCWGVHRNYCGSIPKRVYTNPTLGAWTRCGQGDTEVERRAWAQTFCGEICTWQCSEPGQVCTTLNHNWCGSDYDEV